MRFGKLGAGFGSLGAQGGSSGDPIIPGLITARSGNYSWSGDTMAPVVDRFISGGAGSYAWTGQDASFPRDRVIAASGGSYTWTGQDATLTIGSSFTPASLSPSLWIEAATSSLFQSNAGTTAATANGDPVGYVTDLSGNGFDLTSTGDDTTRPTLQGVGTFPYLDFDGSNDKIRRVANLALYSGGACSLFVAARGNPATNRCFVGEFTGVALVEYLQSNSTTATTESVFIRAEDGSTVMVALTDITEANAWDNTDNVVGITDSGTVVTSYVDGSSTDSFSYTRSGTLTPTKFAIGAELRSAGGQFFAGRLYGLVAVNRVINSTERANLVTYLGALMGRTL